jgi:UDP:flavonoid glycosyltransferase YjiC (YdhE family)
MRVRVLISTTRGAGHFGPLAPFAAACRHAGMEVLVAGPRSAAAMVSEAGLAFTAFDDPPEEERAEVFARTRGLSCDEANALVVNEVFGRIYTRASLPRLAPVFEGWQPDVVLRDPCEFASALLAEGHGIPQARVAIGLGAVSELALGWAAETLGRLRAEVGLSPDPAASTIRSSPYLTVVPPSLEHPVLPGPTHTRRFRIPAESSAPTVLPDWWPGREGPLVYVSFGSVAPSFGYFPEIYRAAIDALAGRDIRVLVTVGTDADPRALGPLPPGVHVERWVPQPVVMAHAAAAVVHGGFGSTMHALLAGVPLVLVPLFADQPHNARRVAACGAGIALEGGPAALGGLGAAVRRLLDEAPFAARAREVAAEAQTLPPIEHAAELVDDLAAQRSAAMVAGTP